MRGLISLTLLVALATASPAQIFSGTWLLDDGQGGSSNGSFQQDLSAWPDSDGSVQLVGSAQLQSSPPNNTLWALQVVLGNSWWRWAAPQAPQSSVKDVAGSYLVDFGAAGQISMTHQLDLEQASGSLEVYLQGLATQLLPNPDGPFWIEVVMDSGVDQNGNVQGAGCIRIDGEQVATFFELATISPYENLSFVPVQQTSISVLVEPAGNSLSMLGRAAIRARKSLSISVEANRGNGAEWVGSGSVQLRPSTASELMAISGGLGLADPSFDALMPLFDMGWSTALQRAFQPGTPWDIAPSFLQGIQYLDFGQLGTIELYFEADCAQGYLYAFYDLTNFNQQGLAGWNKSYLLDLRESSSGIGNGSLQTTGTISVLGNEIAQTLGQFAMSPAPDTAQAPVVVVGQTISHLISTQSPYSMSFSGNGRSDVGGGNAWSGSLDLGATELDFLGSFDATPLPSAPGSSSFEVDAQLVFDQPLTNRALLLTQIPTLMSWLRYRSALALYPGLAARLWNHHYVFDFFDAGTGTSDVTIDEQSESADSSSDLDRLILALLSTLDDEICLRIDEYGSQGDGAQSVDDGCVTICEIDPNTQEEICRADCEVRYSGVTESLPKWQDTLFELYADAHFCLYFLPDGKTVQLLGEWLLTAQPTTGRDPASLVEMSGPWPNPANGRSQLRLRTPQAAPLRAEVVDLRGRRVRLLHDGMIPAGERLLAWDGRDADGGAVAAGVYLVKLQLGEQTFTRKWVVVR